jgi:hypothetical protein
MRFLGVKFFALRFDVYETWIAVSGLSVKLVKLGADFACFR